MLNLDESPPVQQLGRPSALMPTTLPDGRVCYIPPRSPAATAGTPVSKLLLCNLTGPLVRRFCFQGVPAHSQDSQEERYAWLEFEDARI